MLHVHITWPVHGQMTYNGLSRGLIDEDCQFNDMEIPSRILLAYVSPVTRVGLYSPSGRPFGAQGRCYVLSCCFHRTSMKLSSPACRTRRNCSRLRWVSAAAVDGAVPGCLSDTATLVLSWGQCHIPASFQGLSLDSLSMPWIIPRVGSRSSNFNIDTLQLGDVQDAEAANPIQVGAPRFA